jgi:hypothetical protein
MSDPNEYRRQLGNLEKNLGQAILEGESVAHETPSMKYQTVRYAGKKDIEIREPTVGFKFKQAVPNEAQFLTSIIIKEPGLFGELSD